MPKTLAVVVHGLGADHRKMNDVMRAVRETYGADIEICDPDLAYRSVFSMIRATQIVGQILARIDQCVTDGKGEIGRIVLVGHSIGATLVRRAFLVAAGNPGNFRPEPGLENEPARPWAPLVERLILLAAFNRGWSISARMSWIYAIGFNVAGLIGHLFPILTPTIFDFRLGAPFMVQTRLHWMAYRRARREEMLRGMDVHRPILIQIIGTQDDLISPIDQVDIAVDGTGRAFTHDGQQVVKAGGHRDRDRDYFLLETPFTNHDDAITLYGDEAADERRRLFAVAATSDRAGIHAEAIDAALLTDAVALVDRTVEKVVFVIHGIRDDGFWTHRIAERIRAAAKDERKLEFRSWTPTYGYFAMLPFMLPWIRRQKVEWFMDQYVSAFAQYPKADFHYIGHSNGTYLGARSLEDYPAFHLERVLFAGSVVRTRFPWQAEMIGKGRVQQFQNLVGSADWVVALLPKSVDWWNLDLGGAGFDGFDDAGKGAPLHQLKYVRGGHGAGIREEHWGQIAEFILHGTPIEKETGPRSRLYAEGHPGLLALISSTRLVMPLLLAIFALAVPASILCLHLSWAWSFAWTPWRLLGLVLYLALLRFVVLRF